MDAAAYHADPCEQPSLSSHIANILLRQSPAHAWYAHPRLNPNYRPTEATKFDYGTAAHAMLLEGDRDALMVVDAPDWRTKAAKEAREAAYAAGKTPILLRQFDKVEAMVWRAKAVAGAFLSEHGKPEQTVMWQEPGIWCRARPDWLQGTVILDYKTTTNAAPGYVCDRVLAQMGYDVQAAFYLRGLKATTGADHTWVWLFQETEAPFACSLVSMGPAMLTIAERKVEKAIGIWRQCIATGSWPAYEQRVHYAEPTPWQLAQSEEMDADIQEDEDE